MPFFTMIRNKKRTVTFEISEGKLEFVTFHGVPSVSSHSFHSHGRFIEAALAASDDCIKIISLDGTLQYMSEGGQRVMEVEDFEALRGCPWPDFWKDQGNDSAIAAIEAAREGKVSRFTGYAETAKGNLRYWDVKVSPIRGEDGSVESILSVSRDITALQNYREQQALLRNELSHRIKNILALVQAIASQTLQGDAAMEAGRNDFFKRLAVLGRAQDLMVQDVKGATTLKAVVEAGALDQPSRIMFDGPEVTVSSRGALALTLAVHELTTNATKYGALSVEDGRVTVRWLVEDNQDLVFRWIERGGPPVVEPNRKGFGSRMIERALASYVGGTASIKYDPEGVTFELRASLAALGES